ncbi:MAG: DEAD/DEAH box helicase, partial [Bacillota bacterium]|nr:DEAD/DEAH box helicase [Bacillota bacterium]
MIIEGTTKRYRGFVLDPFQQEAIEYVDGNHSVLVAAPTGVGKTLIADYLIEKTYGESGRVVYTAPIKALSNQKFKEFKGLLGEEAVGILTGDVVVNPEAPILIMTTEIFRNLLQQSPDRVADVRYVIFDEIHYIDDPERGSVWEESLIFMPETMRFLGLSATIPNVEQLAAWISEIRRQEVKIVTHSERTVPLRHYIYEESMGVVPASQFKKHYTKISGKIKGLDARQIPKTTHVDLVDEIKDDYLPCLFFTFSRKKAELNAVELGWEHNFLTPAERKQAEALIEEVIQRYPPILSERWSSLRSLLVRGIGYHHAGMLPALKDVVEELFTHRLIKVLYCTETFAVGLNFPCRTVCFDSSTKWDGQTFRTISNREYFQMAGRAGRRGIDTEGFVFTMVDLQYFDPQELPSMKESEIEPLQSQFNLTYNSVLNLIKNYEDQQIYRILGQNFATYQALDDRSSLRRQIKELKAELDKYCEHLDGDSCPVEYERLVRNKKRLQGILRTTKNAPSKRRLRKEI